MRTVIDATTSAVKDEVVKGAKKAVAKLAERGVKRTIEVAIDKFPGATRRTVRGVKIATESVKEAGRDLRARRGVKTIDAPEVEVKSSDE